MTNSNAYRSDSHIPTEKSRVKESHAREINRLISQITMLTARIAGNYPELYQFLDEAPVTIPSDSHPVISRGVLQEYLESLEELWQHADKN